MIDPVSFSIKMLSAEMTTIGDRPAIRVVFSDEPMLIHTYPIEFFRDGVADMMPNVVKMLLILDFLQDGISGKTAVLNCSDPSDVWIKGVVE